MNREDHRHATERFVRRVVCAQVGWDEARLPIVSVNDPGLPLRCRGRRSLQRGAGENAEAHSVIRIVEVGFAVETRTVEELRNVDEDRAHALRDRVLDVSDVEAASARPTNDERSPIDKLPGAHTAVAREDDRDAVPEPGQRFGQRRRNVCEAARLRKGHSLGCHHPYASCDRVSG